MPLSLCTKTDRTAGDEAYMKEITSDQNPLIKKLFSVRKGDPHLYFIDGLRLIERAHQNGIQIDQLLYHFPLLTKEEKNWIESCSSIPSVALGEKAFRKVAYAKDSSSLIAVARKKNLSKEQLQEKLLKLPSPLLIVLESVEKPGNLGAILRTADAGGATAVILLDRNVDPYNSNVIKASLGACFTVPCFEMSSLELNSFLEARSFQLIATSPDQEVSYSAIDFRLPTLLFMGREDRGLSQYWLEKADQRVSIPMLGKMDSLNVSVATGILLYERVRQLYGSSL